MQVHAKSAKIGNAKGRKVLTYDESYFGVSVFTLRPLRPAGLALPKRLCEGDCR
jgi:hypothetical protein